MHFIRQGTVDRPFHALLSTGVPHIAPIHINWLRDQASSRANNMRGGSGPRAMPASPEKTAHRPQEETEDCDLSRIILQYVLLAFLLPHFLRELYFLAGAEAVCMGGLAHKWLTSLLHGDKSHRTSSSCSLIITWYLSLIVVSTYCSFLIRWSWTTL